MISGVINVYKEEGYTSQDVAAIVKKIFKGAKTGHTGTLDPIACGVLPICLGKATKIADYIQSGSKTYKAVMRLGIVTDTEDITGNILNIKNVDIDEDTVLKTVLSFKGAYMQTPPMYSAVKINGQRLYKMARAGKEIERPARKVNIYDIKIMSFDMPDATLVVDCSKGVYIRTLISDIGNKLGCGACMTALIRTRVGGFFADCAVTLGKLKELAEAGGTEKIIHKIDNVLNYNKFIIMPEADLLLYNGNKIPIDKINNAEPICLGEKVFLYDSKNILCGIYSHEEQGILKPAAMFM